MRRDEVFGEREELKQRQKEKRKDGVWYYKHIRITELKCSQRRLGEIMGNYILWVRVVHGRVTCGHSSLREKS